jgi:RHS repeat-associated protein
VYNALDQLVKQSGGPSGTVHYVYDEAGHLLGEYNSTGALIQETIWLGDTPVATLRPGTPIGIFYVHTDHLNTPRRITQPSGNQLRWTWEADPFGTATPSENPASLGTFKYNLRFPGQIYDSHGGLMQNYFRDYDAVTGRYVESDPIGLGGGINTYAYALGSPTMYTDANGQFVVLVPVVTGAVGLIAGFGGSLIGQLISNRGRIECINWKNAFIAGGVGAVAGAAAPFAATTWLGAAGLGAGANTVQYAITQYANGQSMSAIGAGWNAVTGALGGAIGGRIVRPSLLFNERSQWLDSALARALNEQSYIAANTGLGNFLRNLGGATVGSVDPPSNQTNQCETGCPR